MVAALMPARQNKTGTDRHGKRGAGTKDVFARLDADTVEKFDKIVDAMQPRTTRSAVIAHLIEQFVSGERAKTKS